MHITLGNAHVRAPLHTTAAPVHPAPAVPAPRELPDELEAALGQLRDADLSFDVSRRAGFLADLIGPLGYLTHGWLPADSFQGGPVLMLREQACSRDGVAFGEDNLRLAEGVRVLGMRDTQGGADSYFLYHWPEGVPIEAARVFTVCIESGRSTGRYEIHVSEPMGWEAFLDQLT
jgi:hypothetical protein